MMIIKKTLLWILTIFFALTTLAYLPGLAGIFSFLTMLFLLPLQKWQNILKAYIKGKSKVVLTILLVLATFFFVPTSEETVLEDNLTSTDTTMEAITENENDQSSTRGEVLVVPSSKDEPEVSDDNSLPSKLPNSTEDEVTKTTPDKDIPIVTSISDESTVVILPTDTPDTEDTETNDTPSKNIPSENVSTTEPKPEPESESETKVEVPTSPPTTPVVVPSDEDNGRDYVLNTNTEKFHYPSCNSVTDIQPHNREDFHGDRETIISRGFVPCKRCNP